MNKAGLVAVVAKEAGLSKAAAEKALASILDNIIKGTKRGGVQLTGFGTFSVGRRGARMVRNPRTGTAMKIAACKVVKFRAGKAYKGSL